ncbi:MAG TPA: hypothetical protein VIG86_02585, partial [Candidatus Dormibacteraeota bacterium]
MAVPTDRLADHVAVMDSQWLARLRGRVGELLPPETPAPAVTLNLPLSAFIGALVLLSVVSAFISIRPVADMGTLILGGGVLF